MPPREEDQSMPIQMDVQMNYEQYFEANRLFLLHTTRKRRWNFLAAWYLCPVLSVVLLGECVWLWTLTRQVSMTIFWCALLAVICGWCRIGYVRRLKSLFSQQERHLSGVLRLDVSGLDYDRSDGTANAHLTWAAFESWLEAPESFLLFTICSFTRIPKEQLDLAQQVEVRGWISAAIKLAR